VNKLGGVVLGGVLGGGTGLILGIIIGALIFGGFSWLTTGGLPVPYDTVHSKVANGFTANDLTDQVSLNMKHIITGSATFHMYAVPQDAFIPKNKYTQSLWTFCSGDDIDLTMTIWGPGENGEYMVEFGRHAGNEIVIRGYGNTFTFPKDSSIGYAVAVLPSA